jgi:hypothetical protein
MLLHGVKRNKFTLPFTFTMVATITLLYHGDDGVCLSPRQNVTAVALFLLTVEQIFVYC